MTHSKKPAAREHDGLGTVLKLGSQNITKTQQSAQHQNSQPFNLARLQQLDRRAAQIANNLAFADAKRALLATQAVERAELRESAAILTALCKRLNRSAEAAR